RDKLVTGVQTCALPISLDILGERTFPLTPLPVSESTGAVAPAVRLLEYYAERARPGGPGPAPETTRAICRALDGLPAALEAIARSEERRVGKECRSRWW